ncbi:fungal-specific transcription factor domain-containing protein [Microdochium trichocladiopsis]|uniref:Fungal-specific transcription factor domain-containing protein n=1 Tax=Microdochium trichocladiopsis TaxID=1682393 RepID=A0A9P8XXR2_9PEZI|nr:fungal-specific transcription factor domain-containing protein [Microdochium trichocladiopsis]KAH7024766.1 fungal-specific transcription factor domain-containing protein [Microdochium trichocladiopsis]
MPTSAPSQNPYLRLYLPMALEEPSTAAKKCLLQGILAVAAYNKAELSTSDRRTYLRQAAEFKNQAAEMLRDIVLGGNDSRPSTAAGASVALGDDTDKQALLAAALTMTTVEVFSGEDQGKGYESLLLGKRIIRLTGGLGWWLQDGPRMTLLQIFRCLEIVAHTSGWLCVSRSSMLSEEDVSDATSTSSSSDSTAEMESLAMAPSPTHQYTLDVSFGVAMKTLRCLNQIIELSSLKSNGSAGEWRDTESAQKVERLEEELFDSLDDPDAFSGHQEAPGGSSAIQEGISSYISEEIKENHVWAFHYATAIFFRRAMCDGRASDTVNPRSTDRPTGQELVSKALEHLENVDALSSDIAVANTLWPGFVAAVEAVDMDLRHRALIWFARARRHGIGNIAKAKALVMEVWRRVDRSGHSDPSSGRRGELGHVDWRDVMREKGMYIMLT